MIEQKYLQALFKLNFCDEHSFLDHTIIIDVCKASLSHLRILMALQNERLSLINGYSYDCFNLAV